jgi:hypothetical protein
MVADLNAAPGIHASVTLNLFQGLSCSGTCAGTDKWMLEHQSPPVKQVQHDARG